MPEEASHRAQTLTAGAARDDVLSTDLLRIAQAMDEAGDASSADAMRALARQHADRAQGMRAQLAMLNEAASSG